MSTRHTYQNGWIVREHRAKGPDVWVFRWREHQPDGTVKNPKMTVGTVKQFKTVSDVEHEIANKRAEINAGPKPVVMTVAEAWGHFQANELRDPDVDRSPTTIDNFLTNFKNHIIPTWGRTPITEVRTVDVEKWLRTLTKLGHPTEKLAPGTRAKIRNDLSALFSHCIRWQWIAFNPITEVRTSSKRLREPAVLTLAETHAILSHISSQAILVMVLTAAATALRRSEVRGLKWRDLDLEGNWFNLQRGLVRKHVTKMKTEASRRKLPMLPELADVLRQWHEDTAYPGPDEWVFASPVHKGRAPYWPDSILKDHIQPAAAAAGIAKSIGWHTFRHSLGTLLNENGENLKTIQDLLRHASSRVTADIYLHGGDEAKRSALTHMSGLFLVEKTA